MMPSLRPFGFIRVSPSTAFGFLRVYSGIAPGFSSRRLNEEPGETRTFSVLLGAFGYSGFLEVGREGGSVDRADGESMGRDRLREGPRGRRELSAEAADSGWDGSPDRANGQLLQLGSGSGADSTPDSNGQSPQAQRTVVSPLEGDNSPGRGRGSNRGNIATRRLAERGEIHTGSDPLPQLRRHARRAVRRDRSGRAPGPGVGRPGHSRMPALRPVPQLKLEGSPRRRE